MKKIPALLMLLLVLAPGRGWSQTTETQAYQISVTIPASVTQVNRTADTAQTADQRVLPQLVQTQQLVRNGRALTVTSIVVR